MLGENIGGETGKVTVQRVLPNGGGPPKTETSVRATGSLLGIETTDIGSYDSVLRADGTLFGEGQGIVMGKGGQVATWVGQGVGTIKEGGAVAFRGAVYYESSSPDWSRLNSRAALFEYEVDAEGNTKSELWEWV